MSFICLLSVFCRLLSVGCWLLVVVCLVFLFGIWLLFVVCYVWFVGSSLLVVACWFRVLFYCVGCGLNMCCVLCVFVSVVCRLLCGARCVLCVVSCVWFVGVWLLFVV